MIPDKQIKAEEYFGPGGYEYLGNGEFQGVQGSQGPQGMSASFALCTEIFVPELMGFSGGVIGHNPQAHYGATR